MHYLDNVDEIAEDIWQQHKDKLPSYGPNMLTLLVSVRVDGSGLPIRNAVVDRLKLRILLAGEENDRT